MVDFNPWPLVSTVVAIFVTLALILVFIHLYERKDSIKIYLILGTTFLALVDLCLVGLLIHLILA